MMSNANTVMIATVIIRFVAILSMHLSVHDQTRSGDLMDGILPTRHPPECFDTPIDISF